VETDPVERALAALIGLGDALDRNGGFGGRGHGSSDRRVTQRGQAGFALFWAIARGSTPCYRPTLCCRRPKPPASPRPASLATVPPTFPAAQPLAIRASG